MEREIHEILELVQNKTMPKTVAKTKLLNLFNVVGQREQLLAFYKYMEPEKSKHEMTKHAISAYLKSK